MKRCWPGILVLLFLYACNGNQEEQLCFHVARGDYTETITVNGTIKAEHTTFINAPRLFLATIIWVEEDGKFVEKGDTVCILEHLETESQLASMLESLDKVEAQLERLEADHQVQLALLEAEIENNNIQLSITSLDSVQKQFAPPLQQELISLEQQKANIRKEKLRKKYNARKTIGETEIRGLQARIRQMKGYIERTEDQLKQCVITTPKSGVLMRSESPTMSFRSMTGEGTVGGKTEEGSLTFPNMSILEIPEMDQMQVLAKLSESDYKKTEAGQKVMIRVESKNNLVTTGTVLRKMLSGNQRNQHSKVNFYEALIDIDSCHAQLTPGINAECDIVISEFTDTLVVPAVTVFEEEGEKFVYLLENKKYWKTPVTTAYSSATYSVISGGLPADSYVALTRPADDRIARKVKQKMNPVAASDTSAIKAHSSDTTIKTQQVKNPGL